MMDKFNNKKPVQIEIGEWWFNGRIIQQNNHPMLSRYISRRDDDNAIPNTWEHATFRDAIKSCLSDENPTPSRFPCDYIGGNPTPIKSEPKSSIGTRVHRPWTQGRKPYRTNMKYHDIVGDINSGASGNYNETDEFHYNDFSISFRSEQTEFRIQLTRSDAERIINHLSECIAAKNPHRKS